MMPTVTRAEIDDILRRLTNVETRFERVENASEYHNKLLVVGNGDPPLKELGRDITAWLTENKSLPETVRTHARWIENTNKFGWAIILLLLTLLGTNIYSTFFAIKP